MGTSFAQETAASESEALLRSANSRSEGRLVRMQPPGLEGGHKAKSKAPTVKRAAGA